jgi:hypothetical protein
MREEQAYQDGWNESAAAHPNDENHDAVFDAIAQAPGQGQETDAWTDPVLTMTAHEVLAYIADVNRGNIHNDERAPFRIAEAWLAANPPAHLEPAGLWPYIPGPSSCEGQNACCEQLAVDSRTFTCTRSKGHEGAHQGELWWPRPEDMDANVEPGTDVVWGPSERPASGPSAGDLNRWGDDRKPHWCVTHSEFAWVYDDDSKTCMYDVITEGYSDDHELRPLTLSWARPAPGPSAGDRQSLVNDLARRWRSLYDFSDMRDFDAELEDMASDTIGWLRLREDR